MHGRGPPSYAAYRSAALSSCALAARIIVQFQQTDTGAGGTADTTINHAMQITAAGSAMTRTYRICAHPSLSTLCL